MRRQKKPTAQPNALTHIEERVDIVYRVAVVITGLIR